MIHSQTILSVERTTNKKVAFDYIVWEFISPTRISVPREAFNRLLQLTARRMRENDGIVGSVRDLAKWAVNGCPCKLAKELGFGDPNQIYATFRYWDTVDALERSGHTIKAVNQKTNSAHFRLNAKLTAA